MAYDERAGERLRTAVAKVVGRRRGLSESRMFGGLSYLVNGHMACGLARDELVVRASWERAEALAKRKHARPCDFTGRPMRGLVTVEPAGFETAASLARWVSEGVEHAYSLPPKATKRAGKTLRKKTAAKKRPAKKASKKKPARKKKAARR